jgi:hypothetical protein
MYWVLLQRYIVVSRDESDRFTVEYYWNVYKIKKKKTLLNEETVQTISIIFFNTGLNGSTAGS